MPRSAGLRSAVLHQSSSLPFFCVFGSVLPAPRTLEWADGKIYAIVVMDLGGRLYSVGLAVGLFSSSWRETAECLEGVFGRVVEDTEAEDFVSREGCPGQESRFVG